LSAFICGLVLTAFIFVSSPQKTSWYAFLFGASIAFLAPAFLIGLLFVSSRKEIALPEIQVKDPSSKRQALILGFGAIAIGLAISIASIASTFDSASKDDAGYELLIRSVDDKSVGMKTSPLDPRNMLVSVAPGAHVLGVTLTWRSGVTGYVTVKEWKISVPIEARADRLYSICMLGKGRPEVELREIGPTSARTTSQEEWQKYAMHPCI
jgi:amino acid transporter